MTEDGGGLIFSLPGQGSVRTTVCEKLVARERDFEVSVDLWELPVEGNGKIALLIKGIGSGRVFQIQVNHVAGSKFLTSTFGPAHNVAGNYGTVKIIHRQSTGALEGLVLFSQNWVSLGSIANVEENLGWEISLSLVGSSAGPSSAVFDNFRADGDSSLTRPPWRCAGKRMVGSRDGQRPLIPVTLTPTPWRIS